MEEIMHVNGDVTAVEVRQAFKSYGSKKHLIPVLTNLDMTVKRGIIYGLLGPSGCGKTTLLKCIIGLLKVDSGRVVSMGRTPGSKGHPIPGKMVGYMPQEMALYNEFTIGEALSYFGRLHRMSSEAIAQRTDFLIDFLHLPEKTRLISRLSGGQQRRTSFAVALLQEPELLILDEPTVGVDPLLRQRIWEHLLEISQSSQTTIIITTHYIEEARQAHMVGLMRNGHLLAESAPDTLLRAHRLQSLEEVFLQLCQQDQTVDIELEDSDDMVTATKLPATADSTTNSTTSSSRRRRHSGRDKPDEKTPLLCSVESQAANSSQEEPSIAFEEPVTGMSCGLSCLYYMPTFSNVWAMLYKSLTVMKRQIGFLLFEFFLPSFQIILFCVCIGSEPYGLNIAVVNNETSVPASLELGSWKFLSLIDAHVIKQTNYTSMIDARHSVETGASWGIIEIGPSFTEDLLLRFKSDPSKIDPKVLNGSIIHLWLDMTNQQISYSMQQEILDGFTKFTVYMMDKYAKGVDPAVAQVPVKVEQPIYGELNPSFTNFMAPGIILSITFFMATGLTALSFVTEKKKGVLERSIIAGVTDLEILIGHIMTQLIIMIMQVTGLLFFTLVVFKIKMEGSIILVIILTLFQGFAGMSLGMLISAVCDEEVAAIQAAIGSMYPSLLMSGIIWPIQSMPTWLRYISYGLPMTLAADSMRCIMARGWGLTYTPVWEGFIVSVAWGWGLLAITLIILQLKKL